MYSIGIWLLRFVSLSQQDIRAVVKDIDSATREATIALQVIHTSIADGK